MRQLLLLPALVLNAQTSAIQIRALHRPLAAMPTPQDLSTPEGAFAALMQVLIEGGELRPVFAKNFQKRLPSGRIKPQPEKTLAVLRPLIIEEVHQAGEGAAILATLGDGSVSVRYLEFEENHWANLGEDDAASLDKARQAATRFLSGRVKASKHTPIANPEAHLATFVKHLEQHGKAPKELLLEAMGTHRLTALGELHNRPTSWATYEGMVEDPRFAERVGTLYLELPGNGQALMDQFLANDSLNPEPVVEILRDLFQVGWPDQAMVQFLCTLWKVNHRLAPEKRIRVRLVDQHWNWREVQTKADTKKLDQARDPLMAENILADLAQNKDSRNAVFLVGYLHLPAQLSLRLDPATKHQNAGTLLRHELKSQFFAAIQHGPVLANAGGAVYGRIRQGLFDEAFARHGSQPVAFLLPGSPFGKEPFDCSWDLRGYAGTYGGAFDAYVFLGPLDQERFAPQVPGFYTEAYAKEVDRRCQLRFGAGVKEVEDLTWNDAAALTAGAARLWGQPRHWIPKLGPVDAWRK